VFFGPISSEYDRTVSRITVKDSFALVVLMLFLIGMGVYPAWIAPLVESGVQPVLRILGGG
jgi:NADH:ubiquinone oxidoreductase subunit 4 (subunit M)